MLPVAWSYIIEVIIQPPTSGVKNYIILVTRLPVLSQAIKSSKCNWFIHVGNIQQEYSSRSNKNYFYEWDFRQRYQCISVAFTWKNSYFSCFTVPWLSETWMFLLFSDCVFIIFEKAILSFLFLHFFTAENAFIGVCFAICCTDWIHFSGTKM